MAADEILPSERDLSIDVEMNKGLLAIHRIMNKTLAEVRDNKGTIPKDTVLNLKACMDMLRDLKKQEQELLAALSDEALEKAADDNPVRS